MDATNNFHLTTYRSVGNVHAVPMTNPSHFRAAGLVGETSVVVRLSVLVLRALPITTGGSLI
jgi:hypothetical protein